MEPTLSSMIAASDKGDGSATKAVFATLYSELHKRAKRGLGRYSAPVSLSPTTLLHQAYLDMADREGSMFPDEARFIAYAARVMRGLIIDHARNHQAKFERTIISVVGPRNNEDRTAREAARYTRNRWAYRCLLRRRL